MQVRWYSSINTKLFLFISIFALAAAVFAGIQSHKRMSEAVRTQFDAKNQALLQNSANLIVLELQRTEQRAVDLLFSVEPESARDLQLRLKSLLRALESLRFVSVEWNGQTVAAAQTEAEERLGAYKHYFRTRRQSSLFSLGGRQYLLYQFATGSGDLKIQLVSDPRALAEAFPHLKEQKVYSVSYDKIRRDPKERLVVLARGAELADLTYREVPLSLFAKTNNEGVTERRWARSRENEVRHYLRQLPKSDIRVGLRADFRGPLQRVTYDIRQNVYALLVILGLAVLVSYFASVRFNHSLQRLIVATVRIASGDLGTMISMRDRSELALLGSSINAMTVQLQHFVQGQVESARKAQELLTAKAVEEQFFISERTKVKSNLQVKGTHMSASECAGDWWCHFKIDESRDLVVISDATGHGAGAALLVAIAYSFFQTYVHSVLRDPQNVLTPGQLAERLNEILCGTSKGRSTMTMQIWNFDQERRTASYVNCGHKPSFVVRVIDGPNGEQLQVAAEMNPSDLLGIIPEASYREKQIPFSELKSVFLYSDGLVECPGKSGRTLRTKDLKKIIESLAPKSFEESSMTLVGLMSDHFDGVSAGDDITLVFVDLSIVTDGRRRGEDLHPSSQGPSDEPPAIQALLQSSGNREAS